MIPTRGPEPGGDSSLPGLAGELKDMVVAYVKQETLEPIKGLGRFVALGLAGSVLAGIGLVLLILALLRVLQGETGSAFTGSLSWAPYAITLLASALVAAMAARTITAPRRQAARRDSAR
ncbi:MAG: hypothetical protein ACRDZW_08060 [Acidimicrobiales bacterium]